MSWQTKVPVASHPYGVVTWIVCPSVGFWTSPADMGCPSLQWTYLSPTTIPFDKFCLLRALRRLRWTPCHLTRAYGIPSPCFLQTSSSTGTFPSCGGSEARVSWFLLFMQRQLGSQHWPQGDRFRSLYGMVTPFPRSQVEEKNTINIYRL